MEAKVKDQEEELDEQAGSIQMLEQVLTKQRALIPWKLEIWEKSRCLCP